MKITLTKADLLAAIAVVKPVARASSLPILSNLLLAANEKSVTVTGTNLDTFVRCRADAIVNEKGSCTVPAALLHDIARTAGADNLALETGKNSLKITCGESKFELPSLNADEFPGWPVLRPREREKAAGRPDEGSGDVVEFTLEDAAFNGMLAVTSFCSSRDDTRYVLNGSLLEFNGDAAPGSGFKVVATDGRRLAITSDELPPDFPSTAAGALDLIVPSQAVAELRRLLGTDADKPVRLAVATGHNLIQFAWSDITLLTKLVEGNYPNYSQIMPDEKTPVATLDRALLLAAVERVGLVSDNLELAFKKSSLTITSARPSDPKMLLGDASDKLLVPASREIVCTMRAAYLREALVAVAEPSLEFHSAKNIHMLKTLPTAAHHWRAVIAGTVDEKKAARNEQAGAPVSDPAPAKPAAKVEPEPTRKAK